MRRTKTKLIIAGLILTFNFASAGMIFEGDLKGGYSCEEGKRKTCKTINSCEEAMFYLKQCGIRRLDADNDGIPCECQACISKNPTANRCKYYR
jgi:hypothetical protein